MRQLKHMTWLLAFMLLIFPACTERIDIELDSTYTRLVVYGTVTTDSVRHSVELTTTSDYFSNQPAPRVKDAIVELEFNGSTMLLEECDTLDGLYMAPYAFRGLPGTTYHLKISMVDVDQDGNWETYQATSTMPAETARLDSIYLGYFFIPWWTAWEVYMVAQDPAGTRDWYGVKVWKNSTLITDSLYYYTVFTDDFYDGQYLYYGYAIAYLSDSIERERLYPGDTVTLELNCIEKAFYDFVGDARWELLGNNPLFSGPPANIRSNLDNEALGIFTAYAIERASSIVPAEIPLK